MNSINGKNDWHQKCVILVINNILPSKIYRYIKMNNISNIQYPEKIYHT
jgi:hypothetical protein